MDKILTTNKKPESQKQEARNPQDASFTELPPPQEPAPDVWGDSQVNTPEHWSYSSVGESGKQETIAIKVLHREIENIKKSNNRLAHSEKVEVAA